MKSIPIRYKGETFQVLIDDGDFDLVNQYHWNIRPGKLTKYAHGYKIGIPRRKQSPSRILMHRLIMAAPDGIEVDHENRNGLDCRRENLRFITSAGNKRNLDYRENNSGFKNVRKRKSGKFRSYISINKKRIHLGTFDKPEDAHTAYQEAYNKQIKNDLLEEVTLPEEVKIVSLAFEDAKTENEGLENWDD